MWQVINLFISICSFILYHDEEVLAVIVSPENILKPTLNFKSSLKYLIFKDYLYNPILSVL